MSKPQAASREPQEASVAPEEKLLILLSYAQLDEGEVEEARQLAAKVSDWEPFWRLAAENATEPLVRRNLERIGRFDDLPAEIQTRFREKSDRIRAANEARLHQGKLLFARFAGRRIPVVILKGVLFAETIYGDPFYKKMNDIDILIRREDLEAVYDVYDELKYFSMGELIGGKRRKQEKFSHHTPPFFSRDLKLMVGTHWGLITPLAPYTLDYEAIWSRVVPVDFYGLPALGMAPEDNLHHLCVHLPYYKTGVRELADIYNLIRHYGAALDWGLFLAEVRKAKTESLVHHALSLAHRLSPSVEAAEAIRAVEPRVSRFYRRDTARKTRSISLLLRSRSVHMSRIEKAFTDLNTTKKAGERWTAYKRILRHLYFPPDEDVAKMNSLPRAGFWARRACAGRIRRVFYRDVGRALFWLLFAKVSLEVAGAVLTAPFRKRPADTYETYAGRLGLSVADIQTLKEALE